MANKAISELPQAQNVNNQDLFVLEQGGIAKKLPAETFITEQGIIDALAEALDGHGGIQSVTLSSVSGRIRTYLITFTDGSATTFQVYDGTTIERIAKTSTAGLVDTYTVFMNDGTTTFFTVTNGADGTVSEAMLNDALKNKAPVITETTESSAIANFTDGADDMVMHHVVAEINPVQDLSNGDPSPTNICPITGHTEVNVTRTGKNLLNYSTFEVGTIDSNTGQTQAANNRVRSGFIFLKEGQYTISSLNGFDTVFDVYDLEKNFIKTESTTAWNATPHTYMILGDRYVRILFRKSNNSTITLAELTGEQLELGSTATAYEPYQSNTVTVDWTSQAGTVYGGTIDVATGLLTVDKICFSVLSSTPSISYKGSGNTAYIQIDHPPISNNRWQDLTCSHFKNANIYAGGTAQGVGCYSGQFYIRDSLFTNLTDFTEWIAAQETANTPLQICYKLATPQTYQLTGQQLMTLLGTNNVWADTGNVSVTYPADTKMFIENLTQPTEDDMTANQAITSGKYFMIGNSLYLALANIASGAQITIGTNAQRVSLADALNAINS